MLKRLQTIFLGCILACSLLSIGYVSSGRLYDEYLNLSDFRRLHPDFLPSVEASKITSLGHTTTYADIMWIRLIQFIGDNIINRGFIKHTPSIGEHITELHPYFSRAYILALLLSPRVDKDLPTYDEDRLLAEKTFALGKKGIMRLCDEKKISLIDKEEPSKDLWTKTALKNPCADGMLPYYLGYVASTLGDQKSAELYYKIASMNTDAPEASRFLMLLMRAKQGDYIEVGKKFLLIAMDGYDEYPFTCQHTSQEILGLIGQKQNFETNTLKKIEHLESLSQNIPSSNPLAMSATNCHDSLERGVKQLYIGYIANKAQGTKITTAEELEKRGMIDHIPLTSFQRKSQNKWTILVGDENIWTYKPLYGTGNTQK